MGIKRKKVGTRSIGYPRKSAKTALMNRLAQKLRVRPASGLNRIVNDALAKYEAKKEQDDD